MDLLKKAGETLNKGNSSNNNEQQTQNQGGDNNQQQGDSSNNADKQDYLDKGIGFVSKKAGYNIDRNTEEKIGDGARGAYEKFSGSKVPEKFSN
ncbi:hypothetical protein MY5147_008718 [Beauveria neobassiana]|uniref:Uncharacterized protein n=3 Tax=Beauveria bassiana TaxID=176275 RepID=J4KPH0_BEAB2|nr:uncharacterized protein BBA_03219 [Beauveria bassiana ARSEF 2860]KAF1734265.1 hypothetical protein CRV24_005802 [Beauveria bassiana]KGQ03002.1 hypothetical protein BBAD15_g11783 [Beauveria bassiana D1-5]EJP67439.1 hypothetical protein BBA_03219 [Beauveria bassiana ARSEF 2860]KAH8709231.1 hypothetical protein HC256_009154 [Beauveria bassiana]PQK13598.1 hypothetical protein BB8028_0004g05290 [Beauveria bassiana]